MRRVLILTLILLSGCDLIKMEPASVCDYSDDCRMNPYDSPPCCSDVGLIEPFNWSDYEPTNMCCFPSDCPQAKNNPEQCTCIYMVECFEVDANDTR